MILCRIMPRTRSRVPCFHSYDLFTVSSNSLHLRLVQTLFFVFLFDSYIHSFIPESCNTKVVRGKAKREKFKSRVKNVCVRFSTAAASAPPASHCLAYSVAFRGHSGKHKNTTFLTANRFRNIKLCVFTDFGKEK